MFHLIWYVLIGLVSGVIAKSVMHVHMTLFWTIVLGIIGAIIGGAVTHMFSRPKNERSRCSKTSLKSPLTNRYSCCIVRIR
jgi:uncharacterized membrane protein YeaQ/YmgE (transglycosylase-associated protein family)